MNTLKNILVVAMLMIAFVSCKNEKQPEVKTVETEHKTAKKKLDPNATYAKAEFTIKGMTCEIGCARTIQKKLAKMDGVKSAEVDFERELAMVEYDEAMVSPKSLEKTVVNLGEGDAYHVTNIATVDTFSAKKECAADCTKACCKDMTEAEKKACAADCTMACCKDKAETKEKSLN